MKYRVCDRSHDTNVADAEWLTRNADKPISRRLAIPKCIGADEARELLIVPAFAAMRRSNIHESGAAVTSIGNSFDHPLITRMRRSALTTYQPRQAACCTLHPTWDVQAVVDSGQTVIGFVLGFRALLPKNIDHNVPKYKDLH